MQARPRIELIAKLLQSLALYQNRQVIVTTHSPLFCGAVLREARSLQDAPEVALLRVSRGHTGTAVRPFDALGPLFRDQEIAEALTASNEDALFEGLLLRGMLDG
jgi:hypothetical protein